MAHSVQTPDSLSDGVCGSREGRYLKLRVYVVKIPAERFAVELFPDRQSFGYAGVVKLNF